MSTKSSTTSAILEESSLNVHNRTPPAYHHHLNHHLLQAPHVPVEIRAVVKLKVKDRIHDKLQGIVMQFITSLNIIFLNSERLIPVQDHDK